MPDTKKNKKRKAPLSYSRYLSSVIAIMLVALFLTVLRVVAVLRDYETSIQYFKLGSVLAACFNGGAVALVLCAFILPMFVDKERFAKIAPAGNTHTVFISFFSAAAIAVFAVFEAKDFFARASADEMETAQSFTQRFHTMSGVCVILAVGFALYFILTAISKPSKTSVRALIGCFGAAFLISRLLVLYFDTSSPINSPIKTLDQMANSAALLFLAGELRLLVSDARPRFAAQTGLAALVLLLPSSVSQLIGSFAGVLPLDTNTLYALFEFTFALYCGNRILSLLFAKKTAPEAGEKVGSAEGIQDAANVKEG